MPRHVVWAVLFLGLGALLGLGQHPRASVVLSVVALGHAVVAALGLLGAVVRLGEGR